MCVYAHYLRESGFALKAWNVLNASLDYHLFIHRQFTSMAVCGSKDVKDLEDSGESRRSPLFLQQMSGPEEPFVHRFTFHDSSIPSSDDGFLASKSQQDTSVMNDDDVNSKLANSVSSLGFVEAAVEIIFPVDAESKA